MINQIRPYTPLQTYFILLQVTLTLQIWHTSPLSPPQLPWELTWSHTPSSPWPLPHHQQGATWALNLLAMTVSSVKITINTPICTHAHMLTSPFSTHWIVISFQISPAIPGTNEY